MHIYIHSKSYEKKSEWLIIQNAWMEYFVFANMRSWLIHVSVLNSKGYTTCGVITVQLVITDLFYIVSNNSTIDKYL